MQKDGRRSQVDHPSAAHLRFEPWGQKAFQSEIPQDLTIPSAATGSLIPACAATTQIYTRACSGLIESGDSREAFDE